MSERTSVWVELPDGELVKVGELENVVNPRGYALRSEFKYDAGFLTHPLAYPLCPELPLTTRTLPTVGGKPLAGAFSDASPDSWGCLLLSHAEAEAARLENRRPRVMREFEYLLAAPDPTRMGALRFTDANGEFLSPARGNVPTMVDLPELLTALTEVDNINPDPNILEVLTRAGTSMGGARPKATIIDDRGRLAMVKLPQRNDAWDVLAWEGVVTRLGRAAGINTVRTCVHRLDADRSVLVSTRFDRAGTHRIGYLSAASLIPDALTDAASGISTSYAQLAASVAHVSADPDADLAELFRRVALTIGINNTDDHVRNHGLLRTKRGWRLAPMFDVNPFPRRNSTGSMSITVGGDPSYREASELLQAADMFRLKPDAARDIIAQVRQAITGWATTALTLGIEKNQLSGWESVFVSPALDT
ncbi:MAG: HipA domain-containing protein [Propionibacteriaceae bacterium]|jgi:serine/threonine-protein kinase HipA|nr:HipA domain-containing protein [Propionibacteriaceae bacterium]